MILTDLRSCVQNIIRTQCRSVPVVLIYRLLQNARNGTRSQAKHFTSTRIKVAFFISSSNSVNGRVYVPIYNNMFSRGKMSSVIFFFSIMTSLITSGILFALTPSAGGWNGWGGAVAADNKAAFTSGIKLNQS